jgi:hypothetical protein
MSQSQFSGIGDNIQAEISTSPIPWVPRPGCAVPSHDENDTENPLAYLDYSQPQDLIERNWATYAGRAKLRCNGPLPHIRS